MARAQSDTTFVVIVNSGNPTTELSNADLKEMFLGRRTQWESAKTVLPVDLGPKLIARKNFSRDVLGLSTTAVTNYWMQEIFGGGKTPPPVVSSVSAAVAYVAANSGAIAYVPADTPLDRVRVVRIVK